ncbi:hypothetical protein NT6N_01070 [Oceaniferula spumae]|uniref:Uncharacterized protein n=1 Tax=Oceaniferula spumae TaxID=2979115 RepID=A0AAT9FGG7_9BACT
MTERTPFNSNVLNLATPRRFRYSLAIHISSFHMPDFFAQPVLNSPYEYPHLHWELDDDNQPTQNIEESRSKVSFHQTPTIQLDAKLD